MADQSNTTKAPVNTSLVKYLREGNPAGFTRLMKEAADEIERLSALVTRLEAHRTGG